MIFLKNNYNSEWFFGNEKIKKRRDPLGRWGVFDNEWYLLGGEIC